MAGNRRVSFTLAAREICDSGQERLPSDKSGTP